MIKAILDNLSIVVSTIIMLITFGGTLFVAFRYKIKLDKSIESQEKLNTDFQVLFAQFRPNGGSSLRDAIDRIEKETAFQSMELKYLDTSNTVGTFRADLDGKITHVSVRLQSMLNHAEAEFIGMSWFDFVHQDDVERVLSAYIRSHSSGLNFNENFRVCRADEWIEVNGFTRRVNVGERVIGYFGSITLI